MLRQVLPFILCVISSSLCSVSVSKFDNVFLNGFNMASAIADFGYPVEVHQNVQTEDGYLLDIHRIPHGRDKSLPKRGPVLLMHDFFTAGDCFVIAGPDRGLAYLLADQGYDVWIGNARGTSHSRKHVKLDPDVEAAFWEFSWHEIGIYDLPAMIRYILKTTKQAQLHFVGHSQGTTDFFAMASDRPEMNKLIKLSVALGPAVFIGIENFVISHPQNSLFFEQIESFRKLIGLNEIGPQMRQFLCNLLHTTPEICDILITAFIRPDLDISHINVTMIPTLLKVFPDRGPLKQFVHHGQNYLSGGFNHYDYGPRLNQRKYKSSEAPPYNLNKVTSPVALFYEQLDYISTPKNTERLAKALPNVVLSYMVPYAGFNHLAYIAANDVVELVYNKVFEIMAKYD